MSKMSKLSKALDELVACGEGLIRTANAIREILSEEPEPVSKPEEWEDTAEAPRAEEPKKYTFMEVRKAFAAKSHAGYTEQVKALITDCGVSKLSAVDEENYPALMAALKDIG